MRFFRWTVWVVVLWCLTTEAALARETGVVDLVAQARAEVAVPGGLGPLAAAGDVNGDGRVDYILGAAQGFRPEADDPGLTGARVVLGETSFRILGEPADESGAAGFTVAAAGDVNGDGLDDVVLTDENGFTDGAALVVYGSREPADVVLSRLGERGFVLDGVSDGSAAGAGDVNGDGLDDLVVGSDEFDTDGGAFVVFGVRTAPPLRQLDELGEGGFAIRPRPGDLSLGATVAPAGDVNDDGLADVIVGAPTSLGRPEPDDAEEPWGPGAAYVVLGRRDTSTVRLGAPRGLAFRLASRKLGLWGAAVAGAGDVNGDGFDDVVVGGPFFPFFGGGAATVVFGRIDPAPVDLARPGSDGFRIDGARPLAGLGLTVAAAGDVDGDGLDDVLASESGFSEYFDEEPDIPGRVHLIYGRRETAPVNVEEPGGLMLRGSGAEHAGRGLAVGGNGAELLVRAPFSCRRGQPATARLYSLDLRQPVSEPAQQETSGTPGARELYGLDGNDRLRGGGGPDCLHGGDDEDRLSAGADADSLWGENGSDDLRAGADADFAVGGAGADRVSGGAGADLLAGSFGRDRILGGRGADELGGDRVVNVDADLSDSDPDRLHGGPGGDRLEGARGNDTLRGGPGGDNLDGLAGADHLNGGAGNDSLDGDVGADRLDGGSGEDSLFAAAGDDRTIARDGERDRIDCGPGRDTVLADRVDALENCERRARRRR